MRFNPEVFNRAPSRLLTALATGAMVSSVAAAEPAATQSAPGTQNSDKTLAPVVVESTRDIGKPERGYKTETTKIGKQASAPKDIPQSITIVPEKLISDRKEDSLMGALQNVAGLTFNAGEGGRIGDNINLRGYVAYGDVYMDGMRDIAQYNREVFNLERVEVLRGSSSMLFGRGSTGGVINQVSKSPFLADENLVSTTVGNHDYFRNTADLNKVVGETSAIRLNTMYTKSNGDPEGADTKRYGIAPSFRTGIGTQDEFEVGYYHLNYDDTPNYGFGWVNGRPLDSTARKFYGVDSDYQRDSADIGTFKYTHRFDNRTQLSNVLRYGEYRRDLFATTARPCTTVSSTCPTANPEVSDSTAFYRGSQHRGGKERHLFDTTDLSSRFEALGMKHEALVGSELAREQSERWSYTGTGTKANGTVGDPDSSEGQDVSTGTRSGLNNFTASTVGIYAQDIVEFMPKWKFLLGTRWDRFEGDYISNTGTSTQTRYGRRDYLWSHRYGLIREITDEFNVYTSYGTSFNTSGDLYQYDATTAKTPPEKSRNIEFGTKGEWLDGQLSTRVAVFRSEKYNERSTDTDTTSGEYLLSGKRHTDGYEFEVNGHITKNWEIFFNYAHMWSNIDQAGSSAASQATVGGPAGNTPTNTGSWWNTYQFLPNWTLGAGVDGQSKRNPSANSSNNAPGYVKYDSMLRYDQPSYSVQLNVNNILDRVYWLAVYNGHAVAGPGRTIQLTTEFRF